MKLQQKEFPYSQYVTQQKKLYINNKSEKKVGQIIHSNTKSSAWKDPHAISNFMSQQENRSINANLTTNPNLPTPAFNNNLNTSTSTNQMQQLYNNLDAQEQQMKLDFYQKQQILQLQKTEGQQVNARLTDLCTEDKAKIGELIKKLAEQKEQNQQLQQQLQKTEKVYKDSVKKMKKETNSILNDSKELQQKFTKSLHLLKQYQEQSHTSTIEANKNSQKEENLSDNNKKLIFQRSDKSNQFQSPEEDQQTDLGSSNLKGNMILNEIQSSINKTSSDKQIADKENSESNNNKINNNNNGLKQLNQQVIIKEWDSNPNINLTQTQNSNLSQILSPIEKQIRAEPLLSNQKKQDEKQSDTHQLAQEINPIINNNTNNFQKNDFIYIENSDAANVNTLIQEKEPEQDSQLLSTSKYQCIQIQQYNKINQQLSDSQQFIQQSKQFPLEVQNTFDSQISDINSQKNLESCGSINRLLDIKNNSVNQNISSNNNYINIINYTDSQGEGAQISTIENENQSQANNIKNYFNNSSVECLENNQQITIKQQNTNQANQISDNKINSNDSSSDEDELEIAKKWLSLKKNQCNQLKQQINDNNKLNSIKKSTQQSNNRDLLTTFQQNKKKEINNPISQDSNYQLNINSKIQAQQDLQSRNIDIFPYQQENDKKNQISSFQQQNSINTPNNTQKINKQELHVDKMTKKDCDQLNQLLDRKLQQLSSQKANNKQNNNNSETKRSLGNYESDHKQLPATISNNQQASIKNPQYSNFTSNNNSANKNQNDLSFNENLSPFKNSINKSNTFDISQTQIQSVQKQSTNVIHEQKQQLGKQNNDCIQQQEIRPIQNINITQNQYDTISQGIQQRDHQIEKSIEENLQLRKKLERQLEAFRSPESQSQNNDTCDYKLLQLQNNSNFKNANDAVRITDNFSIVTTPEPQQLIHPINAYSQQGTSNKKFLQDQYQNSSIIQLCSEQKDMFPLDLSKDQIKLQLKNSISNLNDSEINDITNEIIANRQSQNLQNINKFKSNESTIQFDNSLLLKDSKNQLNFDQQNNSKIFDNFNNSKQGNDNNLHNYNMPFKKNQNSSDNNMQQSVQRQQYNTNHYQQEIINESSANNFNKNNQQLNIINKKKANELYSQSKDQMLDIIDVLQQNDYNLLNDDFYDESLFQIVDDLETNNNYL